MYYVPGGTLQSEGWVVHHGTLEYRIEGVGGSY